MNLRIWSDRRITIPVVALTLLCFVMASFPVRIARADANAALGAVAIGSTGMPTLGGPAPSSEQVTALANVDQATGSAQVSYPFHLETAIGDAQPSLGLRYSSSDGVGFAGVGWTLTVPSIVRKGAAGLPLFSDDVFTATLSGPFNLFNTSAVDTMDTYYVDGQLLVPIAVLSPAGAVLAGSAPGEAFPNFSTLGVTSNVAYFRREVDDTNRYFFTGATWLEQTKSGHLRQYGRPLDGLFTSGVEAANNGVICELGGCTA
jgi:hypothetical protein